MTDTGSSTAPTAGRVTLGGDGRRPLLVAVVSLVTVVAFESLAVTTVMPIVESELGKIWLYGWVFATFYIGTLIGVVVGGNAVDRVRPIGPMLVGIALFVAGLAIGGLAVSMEMLVAGRFLQGLGAGVVPAVSYVVVARGFPSEFHPRVFAAMSTAWVVPALVSPIVASYIAHHIGWRWVFLGLIPVTVVITAVGAPRIAPIGLGSGDQPTSADDVSDPDPSADPTSSGPRRVTISVLVLAVSAAMVIGGLEVSNPLSGLPIAAVGSVVLVVVFRRLTPSGTLSLTPRLPAAVMLRGMLTYTFFAADAYVSLAVTSVRGMTTTFAGFSLLMSSGSWTIGSWLQARAMNSVNHGPPEARHRMSARLVRTGGVLLAVGALGETSALFSSVPVWVWIVSSTTMGLGMGLAYTTISVVVLGEAESGREGEATASLQLSDILGMAMGTGIAGAIVAIGDRVGSGPLLRVLPIFAFSAFMGLVIAASGRRLAGHSTSIDLS